MVPCVHLSDKLMLLACQIIYPHALSIYWDQYFWSEGIIQFWKALLYAVSDAEELSKGCWSSMKLKHTFTYIPPNRL